MQVALFTLVVFLGAFLLLVVEPFAGKALLPSFGGSASVWKTCLAFFQILLLLGYVYADLLRRIPTKPQILLHLLLCALPALAFPFAPVEAPPESSSPVLWQLAWMLRTVGLPFFFLSTAAPLLQRWFSQTDHPRADDPYFLYGASNTGSLLALLAFPFLIEPWLPLSAQENLWSLTYWIQWGLLALCGAWTWRQHKASPGQPSGEPYTPSAPTPWKTRLAWIGLAAVPSSLLLGTTSWLTTDLAPVPLLWVLPLSLYLLSFVVAFSGKEVFSSARQTHGATLLVSVLLASVLAGANQPAWLLFPAHLAVLALVALGAHGELARERPDPEKLTEFYLCLSLGGALGGSFNAFLAPLLFPDTWEYPLALLLSLLVLPRAQRPSDALSWKEALLGLAITAGSLFAAERMHLEGGARIAVAFAPGLVFALRTSYMPLRSTSALLGMVLASLFLLEDTRGTALWSERNFYGTTRVLADPSGDHTLLLHGNTLHGSASHQDQGCTPTTYYSPEGPAGTFFQNADRKNKAHVGIVGLGVGSLACYARPGERWDFYEINPSIIHAAQQDKHFPFLTKSQASHTTILPGDARLTLQKASAQYDILVIDAFNSDSIPAHLLTLEALALYEEKLHPQGTLLFNVSNRFLDLSPVLGKAAHERGWRAWIQTDTAHAAHKTPSRWVVMAREPLKLDAKWAPLSSPSGPLWTDASTPLLPLLHGPPER